MNETFQIAIVTGQHGFQEKEFDSVFESMEGTQFVRQELSEFIKDPNRSRYESILFYNFHRPYPDPQAAEAILNLADRGQGLVILHHAILAFPEWPAYADICGIGERSFGYHPGQRIKVHVADTSHPITAGLANWEMSDETYTMKDAGDDSHTLLTVDHPKSMKIIGWSRTYRKSRVFCLQSGHDNETFSNPQFREVLNRGIRWVARRL